MDDLYYPWLAFMIGGTVLLLWIFIIPPEEPKVLRKPYYDEWNEAAKREEELRDLRDLENDEWVQNRLKDFDFNEGKSHDRDDQHELRT